MTRLFTILVVSGALSGWGFPALAEERDSDSQAVFWQDYFSASPRPADVRERARGLFQQQKFCETIELIQAALRSGQAQPWMYETLSLALQAEGRSLEEIERTLLSAIDLQPPTPGMLFALAREMEQVGLERRALKLLQQTCELDPSLVPAWQRRLEICQRTSDLPATKAAVLGILRRAWPAEHLSLQQQAMDAATALHSKLQAARQVEESKKFQAELAEAMRRDLVIVVTWTGEADVDITVQEPSGGICSHRRPSSSGGGVLLGDSFARTGQPSSKRVSETYACPTAFSGNYRLRVRRVWGKLPTGAVTVDVFTHFGAAENRHVRRTVALKDDDALVTFDLEGGRRQEQLAEHLVANAADQQAAVRRSLLLQQLDQLSSRPSVAQWVRSREFAASQAPLRPQGGAVGYQPVIVVLSEGASLSAQAVISADRRYVRFTGVPLFSGIGDVTTFNMQTGAQTRGHFQGGPQGGAGLGGGGNAFGHAQGGGLGGANAVGHAPN